MRMDFDTLVLSRSELKYLRKLMNGPIRDDDKTATKLAGLVSIGLVTRKPYQMPDTPWTLIITEDGKRYLGYLSRRKRETRFANTMSVLALCVSVVALIVSIVR